MRKELKVFSTAGVRQRNSRATPAKQAMAASGAVAQMQMHLMYNSYIKVFSLETAEEVETV
jgi:hypothetical protein